MIDGVTIKQLDTYSDERGYFRELIRETDNFFNQFGQLNQSLIFQDVIKAWHIHTVQTDYWHVPVGNIKAVLCDRRTDSSTFNQINEFYLGQDYDPIILKIPPLVAHGLKVLQGPALMLYVVSHIYNPSDEGRLSHNDESIGYDWLKIPEIK